MGGRGSGRIGKPTHLKILEGVDEYRINRNEPTPGEASLQPPCELGPAALAVWNRLAPDMIDKKVLTAWDLDQLAVFCDSVAIYQECKTLMDGKYTAVGAAGGVIKSPYWQIMRDCVGVMTTIGARYGLTPGDRARLTVGDSESDEGVSAERLLS